MTTNENSTHWTVETAAEKGARDGVEDVETVLAEQGREVVIATLKPGHLAWDEGAINAGAAHLVGVPEALEAHYYRAYAKAARVRAEEIAAETLADGGPYAVTEALREAAAKICPPGRYAAIGSDGRSEVVWGLGATPRAARDDAREWASQSAVDAEVSRVVVVPHEIAERIEGGEVSVEALGIAFLPEVHT